MELVKDVACCGLGLESLSELVVLTPALIGFQLPRSAQPLPAACVEPPSPCPMGGSSSHQRWAATLHYATWLITVSVALFCFLPNLCSVSCNSIQLH